MENATEDSKVSVIKLVGAETYVCRALPGGQLTRGNTAEVEDKKVADSLLAETYVDPRGNVRRMFLSVSAPSVPTEDEEDLVEENPAEGIPAEELVATRRVAARAARTAK